MGDGAESKLVDRWLAETEATIDGTPVESARTEVALNQWLSEMTVRREGRRARLAEAASVIPGPVWLMLLLGAALTALYLVVFADGRERWWVQAAMIGTIAALIASSLLVIHFLDHPFTQDGAYIPPSEMTTTLQLYEDEVARDPSVTFPCDDQGRPA